MIIMKKGRRIAAIFILAAVMTAGGAVTAFAAETLNDPKEAGHLRILRRGYIFFREEKAQKTQEAVIRQLLSRFILRRNEGKEANKNLVRFR